MPTYLYNDSKTDGKYHEVHNDSCNHLPHSWNRVDLGWQANCRDAIQKAQNLTGSFDFDGCAFCCKDCHKG